MGIVKELVRPGFHGTDFSPVGLWDLNSADGANRLADRSGNAQTLTVNGIVTNIPALRTRSTGTRYANNSARLTSASTILRITGAMSAFCVFYIETPTQTNEIIQWGATGETEAANILYSMIILSGRTFQYLTESGAGVNASLTTTQALSPFEWHHVGFTRSSSTLVTMYVDGVAWASQTLTTPTGGTSAAARFAIGSSNATVNGCVDSVVSSVAIYDTELSAAQVKYLSRKTLGR